MVDETAYRRAVDLDPSNTEAKDALDRIVATTEARSSNMLRYGLASFFALAALVGAGIALLWRSPRYARVARK